jgi:hypothetical protein
MMARQKTRTPITSGRSALAAFPAEGWSSSGSAIDRSVRKKGVPETRHDARIRHTEMMDREELRIALGGFRSREWRRLCSAVRGLSPAKKPP